MRSEFCLFLVLFRSFVVDTLKCLFEETSGVAEGDFKPPAALRSGLSSSD
jgi:hypothetical protein